MENVSNVTEIARGIGDVGMMAITAAFFLLLAGGLMVACFKWFKSIINGMITDNKQLMTDLLFEVLRAMISSMSEVISARGDASVEKLFWTWKSTFASISSCIS